ncbi:unnamed protein product [Adineta steineri]|uniref:Poly [ADP-ribose] polymerase n=1 Tax=Adineta steineri TaxID=433720 RepID=A0A814QRY0_9BILA|nr:unnamed protein product [Adineta steineri]CAF1123383.1 unnamed protein product [Adineta steineri]
MTETCLNFFPHHWKPSICRDCTKMEDEHVMVHIPQIVGKSSSKILLPSRQTTNDNHRNHTIIVSQHESDHRSDADTHLLDDKKKKQISKSTDKLKRKKKRDQRKDDEYRFIELVEKQVQELIVQLDLKNEEIKKLRLDQTKMVHYHETLEKALIEELEYRERRELERQHILTIPRRTPSYWGSNAFSESYREILISNKSKEFDIINSLVNSTISKHGNRYGTINGQDPTAFVVKQIKRIQNIRLWHEYCYQKDSIINKNNTQITDCGSSIYLEGNPIAMPLLDKNANEYWLFHGCDQTHIPDLLQIGYDPRISNSLGIFGGGFYLAENSSKSNQYIPCPRCGGNNRFSREECSCPNESDFVFSIILYRVVLGDVHIAFKYDKVKYCEGAMQNGRQINIRRPPKKANGHNVFDSVMGESIENGGNYLQHREFVIYDRGQAYPEYVIDFQRSTDDTKPAIDIKRLQKKCQHFLKHTFRSVPE